MAMDPPFSVQFFPSAFWSAGYDVYWINIPPFFKQSIYAGHIFRTSFNCFGISTIIFCINTHILKKVLWFHRILSQSLYKNAPPPLLPPPPLPPSSPSWRPHKTSSNILQLLRTFSNSSDQISKSSSDFRKYLKNHTASPKRLFWTVSKISEDFDLRIFEMLYKS